MALLSVALSDARTYLNDQHIADPANRLWTDDLLIPFSIVAHRELQTNLFLNNIPVIKKESAIFTVPANSDNLGSNQPVDLVEPINLKEKGVGEPNERFTDITEAAFIPDIQPTDTIGFWAWDGEIVNLLRCTVDRDVEIYYIKGLTPPATAGAAIGFIYGETYIAPRTASLAAASVGNQAVHDRAKADADVNLDKVIRANIRSSQSVPVRRRPYNWRFKLPRRYIL